MNSLRIDYLSDLARDLANGLESGEITMADLSPTVVVALRRALCPQPLAGAALLAAYPHVFALQVGVRWGLPQIDVAREEDGSWRHGVKHEGTIDEMLAKAEQRAVEVEAETMAAKAAERTEKR